MPQNQRAFLSFVRELLAFVPELRTRAMFGGVGIYQGERMFALIADEQLYLKADEFSRAQFERAGLRAFAYNAKGKRITLSYFEVAPAAFDDPDEMRAWVALACAAAHRSAQPKARTVRKPARRGPD